jgi:hypothetical protein
MTPLLSFAFLVNTVVAKVAISACGQIILIPHGGVRLHPANLLDFIPTRPKGFSSCYLKRLFHFRSVWPADRNRLPKQN